MVRDLSFPSWAILAAICFLGCNSQTNTNVKKPNVAPGPSVKKSNVVPGPSVKKSNVAPGPSVKKPIIAPELAGILEDHRGLADLCKDQGAKVVFGITSIEFGPDWSLANSVESSLRQRTPVTDATLAAIAAKLEAVNSVKSIRSLGFVSTQITDSGLKHLKTFDHLESLDLSGSPNITNAGLEHLKTIKSLRLLFIRGCTQISSKAKADLRRHFKEQHSKTLLITGP